MARQIIDLMDTRSLFLSPVKIGHRTASNRLFAQPMETNTALANGAPGPGTVKRYCDLASGGWGAFCVEFTSVLEEDRPTRPQTALTANTVDAFAAMMDEVRRVNPEPLAFIQLSHNATHLEAGKGGRCSPAPNTDPDCRLMTRDEILKIRDATIQSAVFAQQAGFDGVDVKLCHAFFGAELIAPRNTRDDEYGGSFENRTRFLREIVKEIKAEAPDLLLIARMSIFDEGPGEFGTAGVDDPSPDMTEVHQLLQLMAELGLHIASVTGPPLPGWPEKYSSRPVCEEDLYRALRLPGYVKRGLAGTDVLTLNTGNSAMGDEWPLAARFCIENGLTDLVGFGKQSLADPLLPIKYAEGIPLNGCRLRMGCVAHFNRSAPIRCDEYPR